MNPNDVSFEYHGTHFGRPVGLASYTSSQGIGRRSVPFYQRTGYGGGGSGAKAGQWAPYHGFDTQGKSGIQNWFIKPSEGLGEQYDESQGVRYGHPRLKGIGEWLDANPPEFEEKLLDDPIATNQWMRDNNAELMHQWSEQPPPDLTADTVVNGMPMELAWRLLKDDDDEIRRYTWDNDDDDESEFPGLASLFGTEEEQREEMRLERERRAAADERMREEKERREKIRQGELPRPFAMHTQHELEAMTIDGWADDAYGNSRFVEDPETREQIFDEMNIRGEIEGQAIQDNVNATVIDNHWRGEKLDPNIDIMSADERQDFQEKNASEPMDIAYRLLKAPPYHGTTAESAKKIMVEGLNPYPNDNSATIGLPIVSFATDDPIEAYDHAEESIYDGDVPAVIHIADDVEPVHFGQGWSLYDKTIPPEKLSLEWEAPPHNKEEQDLGEYEKMIQELFNEHLKNKGSPMDIAYRLLKRQTELGEHHDDFPSSHGPVTGYRAVSDEQYKKLPYEGLTGTPITTHLEGIGRIRDNPPKKGIYTWMGHTPTGLDFAREQAQDWADEMSNNRDTPSRVVGIRGSHDLSHMDDYANDWYGVKEDDHDHAAAHIIPHDIPAEQIVRMLKRQTELGEHHEDFPSSHGPVKWYHGTPNTNIESFDDGIKVEPPLENSGKDVRYDAMRDDIPISITDNKEQAEIYADFHHPQEGTLWGIRGDPEGMHDNMKDDQFGEHPVVFQDIPRETIVPIDYDKRNRYFQAVNAAKDVDARTDDVVEDKMNRNVMGIVNHSKWLNSKKGTPMDIAYRLLKARQTKLYNWIQDYPGKDPVQQMSAQPSAYKDNYLEGEYPDEFWSFIGDNPEDTESHGASRHRSDEEGNYLAVGVRGQSPIGELPTRGPARNIPDGGGVRVVGKDDMPDPDDIVVMPKNASHMNNFDPKQKGQFRKPRVRISQ